jgi:WD40 repeat protein
LSLAWHPVIESKLAVGSFDKVVRVHDTKTNKVVALNMHKDRVRSVVWNYEMPWILISAADDS